eukprot:2235610-Rhodomonas_salina.1
MSSAHRQLDNFRRALLNNLDELLAILGGVDVSTAQATHAIDKQRIDAAIITSNVGFNGVNKVSERRGGGDMWRAGWREGVAGS